MLSGSHRILAWGRAPAVHFLALGTLLFALSTRSTGAPARPAIVITADRLAELRDDYVRTMHVVPTPAELDALAARDAEEEMLYRQALLLRLDRGDRAVEWRVIEKVRFLYGDGVGDNGAALQRGLALGLERDDVVVRNALVTKIRLLAKAASRADEPTGPALERDLQEFLQHHADAYAQAERLSVRQIFFSAEKRGASVDDDARAVLRRIRESATPPESTARLGDPFVAGSALYGASRSDLAKVFGDEFAAAVARLEPGRWSEPIRSLYGSHLVWVGRRVAAAVPALDLVRPRVLRAYRAERRSRYLAGMLEELRAAYDVRIEHGPQTL